LPQEREEALTTAALFIDRDGVLNENRDDYVKSWEEFRWLPHALDALVTLSRLQVPIVLVTNQSMIGRGQATAAALERIHEQMLNQIVERGGRVDAILHCPHTPDFGCECRKPRPGLLFRAAREWGIQLHRSVLIGDALTDFQVAMAAGVRYIHVRSGLGRRDLRAIQSVDSAVRVVDDLAAAIPVCATILDHAILDHAMGTVAPVNDGEGAVARQCFPSLDPRSAKLEEMLTDASRVATDCEARH
jgi:D-glycero-D-manno-heptose 1,7-bisphosphate phosphatase